MARDDDRGAAADLALIGLVRVPVGLGLFSAGERYAKRNGKRERSG